MILKVLNLISLLVAEAWLILNFDWEPLIVFIGLLGSLITQEIKTSKIVMSDNKDSIHDKELFNELLSILPSTRNSIIFIKQHDFANSFQPNPLFDLYDFAYQWEIPEKEFLDSKLEKTKKQLLEKIDNLSELTRKNLVTKYNGFLSIDPYGEGYSERDYKIIEQMNKLGDEILFYHQKLIKEGKQKLFK